MAHSARARHVTAFFIRIMTGGVNAAGNSGSGLRRGVSMSRGFAALEKAARGMTGEHDNRQGGEMARARRSLARPSQHISRPVSRVLYGAGEPARDGHSSGTPVARRLKQPTRTAGGDIRLAHRLRDAPRRPYSVLLPVGLAVPPLLPAARCALTTPFHPYLTSRRPRAVCFLWRFPWGRPRRTLSGTACPWSPDFPPARPFGACASGRPAD